MSVHVITRYTGGPEEENNNALRKHIHDDSDEEIYEFFSGDTEARRVMRPKTKSKPMRDESDEEIYEFYSGDTEARRILVPKKRPVDKPIIMQSGGVSSDEAMREFYSRDPEYKHPESISSPMVIDVEEEYERLQKQERERAISKKIQDLKDLKQKKKEEKLQEKEEIKKRRKMATLRFNQQAKAEREKKIKNMFEEIEKSSETQEIADLRKKFAFREFVREEQIAKDRIRLEDKLLPHYAKLSI